MADRTLSRRAFAKALLRKGAGVATLGATASAAAVAQARRDLDMAPGGHILPPPEARVQTTACAYCIVGCGYKVYTWPAGRMGGLKASENAFGVDFPVAPMSGWWVSPEMHNVIEIGGQPHHVIVLPDPEATVVNVGGNHGLGGSLASKMYSPDRPTDRLLFPQLRVDGELIRISWREATDIVARVSRHVLDTRGELAWGMKTYSYQFYENTYAITKLAFDAVNTPCWAPHDSPLNNSDVPGLSDAGVNNFSAAYADWAAAEVIMVSGVSLYEAHGILFDNHVQAGGAQLIVVDPRVSPTAEYALSQGGMHLQIHPGTDTLLHNSLAWVILSEGWEDADFIADQVGHAEDLPGEESSKWRRRRFALTPDAYRDFILSDDRHIPENAAPILGIEAADIIEAARRLAQPDGDGRRPRTSFMLEKGNYWGFNYPNTASYVSLGLICGAGNRPGQMISRAGGHQRGMIKGGSYPTDKSPDRIDGHPVGLDLDRWAREGHLSFAWAIGCTWAAGGTSQASQLFSRLRAQARETGPQLSMGSIFNGDRLDTDAVVSQLNARIDNGGLVFVQQDIFPQQLTELADLVLPAATWGEGRFSRMNGERRLRTYAQIMDPPGECRPDWSIIAEVATKMGYEGFDWTDTRELFRQAGEASGGPHAFGELIAFADEHNVDPMDYAESLGTTGIQCPIRREGESLVGTLRMHEDGFSTESGKAILVRGSFDDVLARMPDLAPQGDELWVINVRCSMTWSAMIEDKRNAFRMDQLPHNPVWMHPDDANARGLSDGQTVRAERQSPPGAFTGVLRVSNQVKAGTVCTYFNYLGELQTAANNVVSSQGDPVSGKVPFKLGRARVMAAD